MCNIIANLRQFIMRQMLRRPRRVLSYYLLSPTMPCSSSTWAVREMPRVRLTWGATHKGRVHKCPTCDVMLLTGETPGFCCGHAGQHFAKVPHLPPLPTEFNSLITHPDISHSSRILNLIFSFAALETTHPFPSLPGSRSFFAIQGKIYHRIRPTHPNSCIRWLLYDGFMAKNCPFHEWASSLPPSWIRSIKKALKRHNPFVRQIQFLSSRIPRCPSATLFLYDSGAAEVAALINDNNTTATRVHMRSLRISTTDNNVQYISVTSRLWEPLAYPLLFPHGTLGWGIGPTSTADNEQRSTTINADVTTTQMWYYRSRILRDDRFRIFGRLTNEYIIDMFSRNLETRLHYIRVNQQRLRTEDTNLMGVDDVNDSDNVYLPASFLGSHRWASEQVNDCLAIGAKFGPPTFFITMTCDPNWPEIQTQLLPGQDFTDIPVVVCRVFHRKLLILLKTLKTMFPNAGRQIYCICSIEFQKRGLPHAHILIKYKKDCMQCDDIDQVVSAELPQDPTDRDLVQRFMIHKHPALNRPASTYCQRTDVSGNRVCRFHYPKPLQDVTTINFEGRVDYRRRSITDEFIVPYNLPLLRAFQCHINFEVANASHLFQYLFKYIHKGLELPILHHTTVFH